MPDRIPTSSAEGTVAGAPVYAPWARRLHWLTVVLLLALFPIGITMASRAERNIWDATTNALYSSHKLIGFVLLCLVVVRLVYRLVQGAPPDEPTLEPWQRLASHVTHWALYALLLVVPVLGWIGVSRYPALDVFGLFRLPALVAPDQKAAQSAFELHKLAAFALAGLAVVHLAAALFHHLVRRDGVLRRMLPVLRHPRER